MIRGAPSWPCHGFGHPKPADFRSEHHGFISDPLYRRYSDAEQLRKLGYTSNFNRSMSLWENFALGFTYLSPVVGVYTLFGLCLAAGGPPMFWAYRCRLRPVAGVPDLR